MLPITIGLLVVTAFLPPSLGAWPGWFGNLLRFFVAPISQPIRGVSAWLSPPTQTKADDQATESLRSQAEGYRQQLLRAQQEIEQLRLQIADLQLGRQLNPDLPVRLMHAAVIGTSSDLSSSLLTIKAGKADGVEVNSVATFRGQQLVGKVVEADVRSCQVQPITSRHAGQIRGVVMLSDLVRGPECSLEPQGDGTLAGPVEDLRQWPEGVQPPPDARPGDPVRPRIGQTVRLQDPSWPKSSQALFIGVVERVDSAPDQPLRQIITVRPALRLERVSEVVLRFSAEAPRDARDSSREGDTP